MVTRYRPSYAAVRNQIVPVMPIDPKGNYVDFVEHKAIVQQLKSSNQLLIEQLERVQRELPDTRIYLGMGESEPLSESFDFKQIEQAIAIAKKGDSQQ